MLLRHDLLFFQYTGLSCLRRHTSRHSYAANQQQLCRCADTHFSCLALRMSGFYKTSPHAAPAFAGAAAHPDDHPRLWKHGKSRHIRTIKRHINRGYRRRWWSITHPDADSDDYSVAARGKFTMRASREVARFAGEIRNLSTSCGIRRKSCASVPPALPVRKTPRRIT